MNRRVHPTELLQKTLQSSVSKFFTPYPTNRDSVRLYWTRKNKFDYIATYC